VRHEVDLAYEHPVSASFNEGSVITALFRGKRADEDENLHVEQATWQHNYVDYWGMRSGLRGVAHSCGNWWSKSQSVVEVDAMALPVIAAAWLVRRVRADRTRE